MSQGNLVFAGVIVTSSASKNLIIYNGYIAVENGKIVKRGSKDEFQTLQREEFWRNYNIIELKYGQFLMPGLIDCHVHGPQFPNIGIGLDRPLLEWLEKYTFPLEIQYHNEEFASKVYNQVVKSLLKNGTTTACYFGTLHLKGTMALVDSVLKYGQRALVGKVSMNLENSAGYYNNTQKELEETEEFLKQVIKIKNPLVEPIITPRFALSCNGELLGKLGDLAEKYDCRIQSHISENLGEIAVVSKLHPNCTSYAHTYDIYKILTNKCIMAHAVHLTDVEIKLLGERGVSIAHCPASNTRLFSGLCPLRKLMNNNITVGLGTDVSGGDSASIVDAMRRSMDVSAHLQLTGDSGAAISWREAFYLATLGGAKALNLDHKIGSLDIGKDFDALLVDVYQSTGHIDQYDYSRANDEDEHQQELVQRFIYLGDDRNIIDVYVQGVKVVV